MQELIQKAELTPAHVARMIGIGYANLLKILRNEMYPGLGTTIKLAVVLKIDPPELASKVAAYRAKELMEQMKMELKTVQSMMELQTRYLVDDMISAGRIRETHDLTELESSLVSLFGQVPPGDLYGIRLAHSQKTENGNDVMRMLFDKPYDKVAQARKLSYALATRFDVPTYDETSLIKLAENINDYASAPDGVNNFIKGMFASGLVFLFFWTAGLRKNYHSASYWVKDNPVIVYTGSFKYTDLFWYAMLHQIAHLILKHSTEIEPLQWCNIRNKKNYLESIRALAKGGAPATNNKATSAEYEANLYILDLIPAALIEQKYAQYGRDVAAVIKALPNVSTDIITGYLRWTRPDLRYRSIIAKEDRIRFAEVYDPGIEKQYMKENK